MDTNDDDLKSINSEDKAAAFAAALRLANNENAEVYLTLGWFFEAGHGCMQDYAQAESYYRKAFRVGIEDSDYYLGRFLAKNGRYDESRKYLESSLMRSNPSAAYWLAVSVRDQSEVNKNFDLYFKYLKLASDSGHLFAQRDLAKAYISGKFGFINRIKGVGYFMSVLCKAIFITNKENNELLYK